MTWIFGKRFDAFFFLFYVFCAQCSDHKDAILGCDFLNYPSREQTLDEHDRPGVFLRDRFLSEINSVPDSFVGVITPRAGSEEKQTSFEPLPALGTCYGFQWDACGHTSNLFESLLEPVLEPQAYPKDKDDEKALFFGRADYDCTHTDGINLDLAGDKQGGSTCLESSYSDVADDSSENFDEEYRGSSSEDDMNLDLEDDKQEGSTYLESSHSNFSDDSCENFDEEYRCSSSEDDMSSDLEDDRQEGSTCLEGSHSDFLDDSSEEEHVAFSRKKRQALLGERTRSLWQRLREGKVRFRDVKDTLYRKTNLLAFQEDILRLLRNNIEILRDGKGFICTGKVGDGFCPTKHVSEAMFHVLCDPNTTLFDMKFELYRQGYVRYSRDFLLGLEISLVISGVHPSRQEIRVRRGDAMNQRLRDIWDAVGKLELAALDEYLRKNCGQGKLYALNKFYKMVIRILWELKRTKHFSRLKVLKADLDAERAKTQDVSTFPSSSRMKEQILTILQKRKNQEYTLPELMSLLCTRDAGYSKKDLLQSALRLALDGLPIIYDRSLQTLVLLDKEAKVCEPIEGTNLLTVVYDLSVQHKATLSPEEIAYCASQYGHLKKTATGKVINRTAVFKSILEYQGALAIQGYIDVECCPKKKQNVIKYQKLLWPSIKNEDEKLPLTDYKKICRTTTQKDLDALRALKERIGEQDFVILQNYMSVSEIKHSEMELKDLIKSGLCKRDYVFSDLLSLCQSHGGKTQDLWSAAGVLTCQKEGGRLLYLPGEEKFVWDKSSVPCPSASSCVARIFVLRCQYPDITNAAILHMLKQEGFQNIEKHFVHKTLRGLETLGFCPCLHNTSAHNLSKQRQFLNTIVRENGETEPLRCASGSVKTQWSIARAIYSWQSDETMEILLQAYITRYLGGHQTSENDDLVPPAKRKKMEEHFQHFGQTIRDAIPALYSLLCSKGLWPDVK